MTLDLVVGIGEIGSAISQLLKERGFEVDEFDIRNPCVVQEHYDFIHICFPDENDGEFIKKVKHHLQYGKVIIHSTVKPTTSKQIGCIYSPVRGVHKTMLADLKHYTKWYSGEKDIGFEKRFVKCQLVKDSTKLELTKILVDTTYYGWLIGYTKLVDYYYDIEWAFANEIHAKHGNRPIMYNDNKPIGGHCVLQNLDLLGKDNIIANFVNHTGTYIGKKPKIRSGDDGHYIRKSVLKYAEKYKWITPLSCGILIGIILGLIGYG